jgi:SET domain-containing protein
VRRYFFRWGNQYAMVHGNGMLYNHSDTPNADFIRFPAARTIHIIAVDDIPAGREITYDYGYELDTRNE